MFSLIACPFVIFSLFAFTSFNRIQLSVVPLGRSSPYHDGDTLRENAKLLRQLLSRCYSYAPIRVSGSNFGRFLSKSRCAIPTWTRYPPIIEAFVHGGDIASSIAALRRDKFKLRSNLNPATGSCRSTPRSCERNSDLAFRRLRNEPSEKQRARWKYSAKPFDSTFRARVNSRKCRRVAARRKSSSELPPRFPRCICVNICVIMPG